MKLTPWLVLLTLSLAACSGSKSAQKVSEETPQIELSDADEFTDTNTEEQPAAETAEAPVEPASDDVTLSNTEPLVQESSLENTSPVVTEPGTLKQYTVQKNETLMMIAFKLYGDYARWKELANENASTLKGGTVVRTGMILNYAAPAEEFVWNPQGNPYLIKTGDTLGTISKDVYATVKKWKLLWENNKPLIKNPDLIFAGFTLYYLENGREVASGI